MADANVSNYLSKLLDNTKDFVDDLLDGAKDLEVDTKESLSKIRESGKDDEDIDTLRDKAQSLTEQIDKLAAVKKSAKK